MRFDSRLAATLAILVLGGAPVVGQDSSAPPSPLETTVPEHLLGMVGDWRLEQEDQALPICALTFTEDQTISGWAITLPEPCPAPFPVAASFASWNVDETDGSVLIMNTEGQLTLRLEEGEDGLFVTPEGQLPAFYLMLPYDEDGTGGEAGDAL